jgi:group I intron endonuclease
VTAKIYKITNLHDGKSYIGQTHHLEDRLKAHQKVGNFLHRAIKKYGWSSFKVDVLEDNIADQTILDEREVFWIKHHNTVAPTGYNLTEGGRGKGLGKLPQTIERRRKISEALKGRKLAESTKQKIAAAHRQLHHTPEVRKKIGQSRARNWRITYPNGTVQIITNLSAFCRNMNTSSQAMLFGCGKCKGYKCEKVKNE